MKKVKYSVQNYQLKIIFVRKKLILKKLMFLKNSEILINESKVRKVSVYEELLRF